MLLDKNIQGLLSSIIGLQAYTIVVFYIEEKPNFLKWLGMYKYWFVTTINVLSFIACL